MEQQLPAVLLRLHRDVQRRLLRLLRRPLDRRTTRRSIGLAGKRDIRFRLQNVRFGYWETYQSYCDYYYDDYYYSRTRSTEADSTATATDSKPEINDGDGKSIMSGSFSKMREGCD